MSETERLKMAEELAEVYRISTLNDEEQLEEVVRKYLSLNRTAMTFYVSQCEGRHPEVSRILSSLRVECSVDHSQRIRAVVARIDGESLYREYVPRIFHKYLEMGRRDLEAPTPPDAVLPTLISINENQTLTYIFKILSQYPKGYPKTIWLIHDIQKLHYLEIIDFLTVGLGSNYSLYRETCRNRLISLFPNFYRLRREISDNRQFNSKIGRAHV